MTDAIPEFRKSDGPVGAMAAFAPGTGARSRAEVGIIILTAVLVI